MIISDINAAFDNMSSIASELRWEFVDTTAENSRLLRENDDLWTAVSVARDYYDASQKEIAFLLDFCVRSNLVLPLEGHFLDINDLTPIEDTQKGNYDSALDSLTWFIEYPGKKKKVNRNE